MDNYILYVQAILDLLRLSIRRMLSRGNLILYTMGLQDNGLWNYERLEIMK